MSPFHIFFFALEILFIIWLFYLPKESKDLVKFYGLISGGLLFFFLHLWVSEYNQEAGKLAIIAGVNFAICFVLKLVKLDRIKDTSI